MERPPYVLNAFRHQRIGHHGLPSDPSRQMSAQRLSASTDRSPLVAADLGLGDLCSTPFGINGSVTNVGRRAVLSATGAQRLSASTDRSRSCWPTCSRMTGCSTPFGINGSVTDLPTPLAVVGVGVLNAFRHQRIGHPIGRVQGRLVPEGAQRLSASTDRSPEGICRGRVARKVLNAFRHQRIGHAWGVNGDGSEPMCSTPFGINGSVTTKKHQARRLVKACSTPFGINGSVTSNGARNEKRPHKGAQRLSASTDRSLDASPLLERVFHVLNAFRHQRIGHTAARRRGPRRCKGAQRLSASTDRSPANCVSCCVISSTCSTPFGINGSVTCRCT